MISCSILLLFVAGTARSAPPKATDSDGDGLGDADEEAIGSNAYDADTDDDGVRDGVEAGPDPSAPRDSDGDGVPDIFDEDDDGDSILTRYEVQYTAEVGADQDEDGIPAWLDLDSDGDTISDRDEAGADSDGDGILDPYDEDSDGDGIPDADEAGDSDLESPPVDTDGDGRPDARDIDSDADGVLDAGDACRTQVGPASRKGCPHVQSGTTEGAVRAPVSVHGGACAGSDRSPSHGAAWPVAAMLLVLFGARCRGAVRIARAWPLGALVLALATPEAGAQGLAVTPAMGGDDTYVSIQGASALGRLDVAVGVFGQHAWRPLVASGAGGDVTLLDHHVVSTFSAALGVGADIEIGLSLPVTLLQVASEGAGSVARSALGDARLSARWHIAGDRLGPAVALAFAATFPTGTAADLTGDDGFTAEPRAVLEWGWPSAHLALNAGYLIRKDVELLGLQVGSELTVGLAAGVDLTPWASLVGEVFGRVPLKLDVRAAEAPVEGLLATRFRLGAGRHVLTLGAGGGLSSGYGAPRLRTFLSYTFVTDDARDWDRDGILDVVDRCPRAAEDRDGIRDDDGCPETDADDDGIPDVADRCPLAPEDADGFADADGCPDPDNDLDRIPDTADACPNEAEDRDGFQDADGCPDPDNDRDGLLDAADRCPNAPETRNGHEDEDGCPDEALPARLGSEEIETRSPIEFGRHARLSPGSLAVVDAVAALLVAHREVTLVRIEAWSDGRRLRPLALARERAMLVRSLLVRRGLDPERLELATHPAAGRRVVLTIGEIDGAAPTNPGWFQSPGQKAVAPRGARRLRGLTP